MVTYHAAAAAIAVILLLIGSAPRSGTAAEIEGVQFADQYQRDDVTLALHCVGLLRYKVVFKGYVAGLYLGPGVAAEEALADVPKRLELSYFWGIKGSDIGKAGDAILARNVDPDTLAQLRPRLDQMNALYETVNPGDRYALTYVPGLGTELALRPGSYKYPRRKKKLWPLFLDFSPSRSPLQFHRETGPPALQQCSG